MFFTRLLQCFGKDLTSCFQCFYKDCTRLLFFLRFPQGFCKAFTRCLQCVLQGFYKAFTNLFTRFSQCVLHGFYDVFYTVCTMFVREAFTIISANFLQGCHSAFIRLLQGFNKVLTTFSQSVFHCFHKAFRKCLLVCFYQALRRLLEIFWGAFRSFLESFQTILTMASRGF
jgi:hypothetical protein